MLCLLAAEIYIVGKFTMRYRDNTTLATNKERVIYTCTGVSFFSGGRGGGGGGNHSMLIGQGFLMVH